MTLLLRSPSPGALTRLATLFLKEIDAITAPPQPAEPAAAPPPTPPRPEPKEPSAGQPAGTANANGTDAAPAPEWQYDTQCSLAGGECSPPGLCLHREPGEVVEMGGG